ncbi:hypothetical protein J2T20_001742 [Paenibacillus wynnii]|nr:hypothetical protein [Paenibacillus wynnii]
MHRMDSLAQLPQLAHRTRSPRIHPYNLAARMKQQDNDNTKRRFVIQLRVYSESNLGGWL